MWKSWGSIIKVIRSLKKKKKDHSLHLKKVWFYPIMVQVWMAGLFQIAILHISLCKIYSPCQGKILQTVSVWTAILSVLYQEPNAVVHLCFLTDMQFLSHCGWRQQRFPPECPSFPKDSKPAQTRWQWNRIQGTACKPTPSRCLHCVTALQRNDSGGSLPLLKSFLINSLLRRKCHR